MRTKPAGLDRHVCEPRVLIAGGGHAGLLLALALHRLGLQAVILDAQPVEATLGAAFAGRALALMYGSKRVFEALGLWTRLADIAEPIQAVSLEDRGTGARITYRAADVADHPFGYGLETCALRRLLLELALERPGIEIVAPARLVAWRRSGKHVAAELDDGRRLGATLLVGADGRASTVRARAGLDGSMRAYAQVALTFAIRHERSHDGRVREFLRPAGPLALLPIGRNLSSVTWIERPGLAQHLLAGSRAVLAAMLDERLGGVLGTFEITGEPMGHALSIHQARRFVAPRIALVGDAAHGIHPIHAQGFNLAVRDVATLAEVLVEAARAGRDLGDAEVLMRYERLRRADARMVAAMTDGLNSLFSTDLGAAKLVRRIGLSALDRLWPLKHLAMRRGMGLSGDLPRLARGEMTADAAADS
ncbi:MAG TPA: FAD-dependent monooxygenase [Geminicoccaceae bacterium]